MKYFRNPETKEEKQRVPPRQRLANGFPVLTYGETPQISKTDWRLDIWGEVEPLSWDWSDLMAQPQHDFQADFHCVTHWSKLDVAWTGVKVSDLMGCLTLFPNAKFLLIHCYGGYTTNLPLADFSHPGVFLAHTLDGQPLPAERGGPVRLVVPHLYAWKSAKWIIGIEVLASEQLGFWEQNGYHRRGDPWHQERYDHP